MLVFWPPRHPERLSAMFTSLTWLLSGHSIHWGYPAQPGSTHPCEDDSHDPRWPQKLNTGEHTHPLTMYGSAWSHQQPYTTCSFFSFCKHYHGLTQLSGTRMKNMLNLKKSYTKSPNPSAARWIDNNLGFFFVHLYFGFQFLQHMHCLLRFAKQHLQKSSL